jgi:hypothetical protein
LFKEYVHGHVSKAPEKTFTNMMLTEHAMSAQLAAHPDLHNMHRFVTPTPKAPEGEEYDENEGPLASQLLGRGYAPSRAETTDIQLLIKQYIEEARPTGWDVDQSTQLAHQAVNARSPRKVWMYKSADAKGQEIVRLESGYKGGKRQNCWVLARWHIDGAAEPVSYVCLIKRLTKVQHPTSSNAEVLRLAACTVYEHKPMVGRMHVADSASISHPANKLWPLDLSSIDCKVVGCFPNGYKKGIMYFLQYYNISKTF